MVLPHLDAAFNLARSRRRRHAGAVPKARKFRQETGRRPRLPFLMMTFDKGDCLAYDTKWKLPAGPPRRSLLLASTKNRLGCSG
jgi:hypothetical protein